MTSEVILMNQHSIALAADSATTVTNWTDGVAQTRFFKGANKIFHVSTSEPVGVMIHKSAELQGMPWDVILKSYRDERGGKTFPFLQDYVDDLFEFIYDSQNLISQDRQETFLIDSAKDTAIKLLVDACREHKRRVDRAAGREENCLDEELDVEREIIRNVKPINGLIVDKMREMTEYDNISGLADDEITKQLMRYETEVVEGINQHRFFKEYEEKLRDLDRDQLARAGFYALFKRELTTLLDTGLVFTGYGDSEYFAQSIGRRVYGIIFDKMLYDDMKDETASIEYEDTSKIIPIAQSNMINTFIHGAAPSTLEKIDQIFGESLQGLLNETGYYGCKSSPEALEELRNTYQKTFKKKLKKYLFKEHTRQLRLIIGMLPVSELAELAETLISIESLKERVTRPTESVSGPIDVAVISKNDGFVWIKRKHYFDEKLNYRFFQRRNLIERENHVEESAQ